MVNNKLPVLLCLHGGGTSGDIFNVQARNIKSRLRQDFEMIFVTAASEGPAGPGVLPFFADAGPFYWWFGGKKNDVSPQDTAALNEKINKTSQDFQKVAKQSLAATGRKMEDVVGVMGFSEGTLASSIFLAQSSRTYEKANGQPRPFANLSFGVLLCPGYRSDVALTVSKYPVKVPTVHVHGTKDPLLASGRALYKAYNSPDLATCVEFNGGHHVPAQPEVLDELARKIVEAYTAGVQLKMGHQKMPYFELARPVMKAASVKVQPMSIRAAAAA